MDIIALLNEKWNKPLRCTHIEETFLLVASLKRSDPVQRGTVALARSSSGTGLLIATKSRLYFL
jgi:hypothetical protein